MRVFKFAEFILIESERALFRGGQAVNLAPKVFDTLLILIKNHGHVVSKNDLMNEVWQDTFVEENNLTQYIFILRKTLGEDHEGRKFIETVPRYGYRFTGDVKEIEADDDSGAAKKVYEVESSIKNEETSAVHTPTAFAPAKLFGSRLILISVSLLLIILVAVSFVNRPDAKGKIWSPNQIKFKRLTESGDLFGAAISADGNSLVYVTRGKQSQLRLKNILTDSEIIIAQSDSGSFNSPHFSPDGNFIFYSYGEASANGAAYRVPVLGGESVRIAENLYSEFSVSPDGRYIAFPRKDEAKKTHEIIIAETNGNGERVAATCAEPEYFELWGPAPAWSRDGARLTVSKGTFGVDGKYLVEFNLANGEEKELPLQDKWYYIARLEWAGKTDLIISGQKEIGEKTQLWQIDFPVGAATRVTNDLTEYDTLDLTGDAQRLVATQTAANYHLWLFDREKNQSRQLTFGENHTDGIAGVAFMPDGRILYRRVKRGNMTFFRSTPTAAMYAN